MFHVKSQIRHLARAYRIMLLRLIGVNQIAFAYHVQMESPESIRL